MFVIRVYYLLSIVTRRGRWEGREGYGVYNTMEAKMVSLPPSFPSEFLIIYIAASAWTNRSCSVERIRVYREIKGLVFPQKNAH